jgi:hypothetical protein
VARAIAKTMMIVRRLCEMRMYRFPANAFTLAYWEN